MKEFFTIGEISKLFNIKIATLRYYDEIGLLKPQYIDENTNYRYYSTMQFEKLNSIKYLRALGIPISKLIDYFNYRKIDTLVDIMEKQRIKINKEKNRLERIEAKINNRLTQIKDAEASHLDLIEEVFIPRMRVAYLNDNYYIGDDIEYSISKLIVAHKAYEHVFLGKIGISISTLDLKNNCFNKYCGIFMILENNEEIHASENVFPWGKYLRIRFKGSHREASIYYKKLFKYMKAHGYELSGASIEIALIDYCITNEEDKYVTEILLPYISI